MKEATWSLHKQAETSGVVYDILKKAVSKRAYTLYLRNLLPVYKSLESHKRAAPMALDTALLRGPAMRLDLNGLAGERADGLPLMESTLNYCASIEKAAEHTPAALLGHYYVRYLGDLNGGAVLGRLLSSALGLEHSVLQFYAFPEISDLAAYRAAYRRAINRVALSPTEQEDAVQAAKLAFEFNIAVSEDVKTYDSSLGIEDSLGNKA